jgi:hypothetical protein
MGAFKKLNRQDVFVVPYKSRKYWSTDVDSLKEPFFSKKIAITGSTNNLFSGSTGFIESLVYQSINHLYYSNFSGSVISGSNENYLQSTLENGSRKLENKAIVYSLSKEVVGESIHPKTLLVNYTSGSNSGSFYDNGEGQVLYNGTKVGDVIYTHGIVTITDSELVSTLENIENITGSWESNFTLYTMNVYCKINDYEFNISQNPSLLIGSQGIFKSFVTGSDFRPYITGIGLYNDANELIAVGKFGQPIPKTPHTDMTFVIKLDM